MNDNYRHWRDWLASSPSQRAASRFRMTYEAKREDLITTKEFWVEMQHYAAIVNRKEDE